MELLRGASLEELQSAGVWLHGGRVLIAAQEAKQLPQYLHKLAPVERESRQLWNTDTVPRVTIDRITNASRIYRVGRTTFAAECGLWLLADVVSGKDILDELLTLLADVGIGGERSAGYGGFMIDDEMTPPHIPLWSGHQAAVTLSRYNPTLEEIRAGVLMGASYELVDVGGWMYTPGVAAQRRQRVRMVEVGAYLHTANGAALRGRLVDVRPRYDMPGAPDHPVIRCGIPLCVGV